MGSLYYLVVFLAVAFFAAAFGFAVLAALVFGFSLVETSSTALPSVLFIAVTSLDFRLAAAFL